MHVDPLKSQQSITNISTGPTQVTQQSNLKKESQEIRKGEVDKDAHETLIEHRSPDPSSQKLLESLANVNKETPNYFEKDAKDYLRGDGTNLWPARSDGLYLVKGPGDKIFAFCKKSNNVFSKECTGTETIKELKDHFDKEDSQLLVPLQGYTIPEGVQKRLLQAGLADIPVPPGTIKGSSATVNASETTAHAEKKSRGFWVIIGTSVSSKLSDAKEFFKAGFTSMINNLREAFAGLQTESEAKAPKGSQKIKISDLNFDSIKKKHVYAPKLQLREILHKKHGELKGSISITYSQPQSIDKLKSQKLNSDKTSATIKLSSQPYGSEGEDDSDLILIAGDQRQGGAHFQAKFAQEETANEEHPVLAAIASEEGDSDNKMKEMRVGAQHSDGQSGSLGAYMKGVPQQCKIDTYKGFTYDVHDENGKVKEIVVVDNLYGGNLKKTYDEYCQKTGNDKEGFINMLTEKGIIKIFDKPKTHDILYFVAPRAYNPTATLHKETNLKQLNKAYDEKASRLAQLVDKKGKQGLSPQEETELTNIKQIKSDIDSLEADLKKIRQVTIEQGYDLFNAFSQPFIAALKNNKTNLPFGPVGTGAFSNNYQFALIQGLLAAHYAAKTEGKSIKLTYHDPEMEGPNRGQRFEDYNSAVDYFNTAIKPMIDEGRTLDEMMTTVVAHAQENGWTNRPVSTT